MNIGFLITPKKDTVWIYEDVSMRQAMEKMEHHRHTAVPIISKEGKYVGSITEGDLLWELKKRLELKKLLGKRQVEELDDLNDVPLAEVARCRTNEPMSIDCEIEEAFRLSLKQGFVPVVDDKGIYIGIILRATVISHLLG